MGILDVLRGQAGGQGDAPMLGSVSAFTKQDVKNLKEYNREFQTLSKLIKSSEKHWDKMGEARSLHRAKGKLTELARAQEKLNRVMKDSNSTMDQRFKAYDKLAEAHQEAVEGVKAHNQAMNEQRGIMGRTLNVLDEFAEHKGMAIFGAAIRDAGIILGDMNQGFDIMARSGQVTNKTMGELAKSTGYYMGQLRLASVSAAQFGITAEDSNAAFAKLTETYGGTSDVVEMLGDNWAGMAAMAKISGLGMEQIAGLADQGWKKLGETMDDTLNTVKDMSEITAEMNQRFGEGSVNSKAFAAAIQEMAYGASFMNQNSKMLTETLGRELQMQLALGRAPEAAMKKAQQNMEMAGKVNIVGVTKFRDAIQAEWNALETDAERDAKLAELVDQFGSEGEIIANMLERGTLQNSESLFAFEKAVKDSSALSARMLDDMRSQAAGGDVGALLSVGLGIDEAQYMIAEARLLTTKLEKLRGAGFEDQAKAMFGENWQSDPEAKKFVESARATGDKRKSMTALHREFRAMGAAGAGAAADLAAEAGGAAQAQPWEKYVATNEGAGWFGGITNSFNTVTQLLATLPVSLAGVLGALLLRRGLAGALGNMAMPGARGGPGMVGRAMGRMGMPTFARAGGAAMRGMGAMGGMAMRAAPGIAIAAMAYKFYDGWNDAAQILGKAEDAPVSALEKASAGVASAFETMTFGLLGSAEEIAKAQTGWQEAAYNMFFKPFEEGGLLSLAKGEGGSMFTGLGDWAAEKFLDMPSAPDDTAKEVDSVGATGKTPAPTAPRAVEDAPPSATPAREGQQGAGPAVAQGQISGGSLILEVQNWDSVFAQSVHRTA